MRFWVGSLGAVVLTACTTDTFAPLDGGDDAADAHVADGSNDGPAQADGAPGEGGTAPFCSTVPAGFCADFDNVTDAATGWSTSFVLRYSLALDSTNSKSPPSSVKMTTTTDATGGSAQLHELFAPTGAYQTVTFDAEVVLPSPATTTPFFVVEFGGTTDATRYGLQHANGSWKVERVDGNESAHAFDQNVTTGAWAHLKMQLTPTSGAVLVTIDTATSMFTASSGLTAGPVALDIGPIASGALTTMGIAFDNVTIRTQ